MPPTMTTRTEATVKGDARIESRDDLLATFAKGEKPKPDWRIGTEHEKFVYRCADHRAPSYAEPGGIRDLLMALTEFGGWMPVEENGNVIALVGPDGAISLEPAGQFELSGAPRTHLHETCAEAGRHLAQVKTVGDRLGLGFLGEAANVVLIGPNGVGKTTIAKNIGYTALLAGHTVLSVTASEMLNDLASHDTSSALQRRLRCYVAPALLLVDEVGYLSYDSRHGDLFFEIVSRRHEKKSIVLTTNRPFAEWNEVFPNSSCVTALVDRLVHRAEIIKIEGGSYRAKEAKERADKNAKRRANRRKGP